jgi:hypothetical protein
MAFRPECGTVWFALQLSSWLIPWGKPKNRKTQTDRIDCEPAVQQYDVKPDNGEDSCSNHCFGAVGMVVAKSRSNKQFDGACSWDRTKVMLPEIKDKWVLTLG